MTSLLINKDYKKFRYLFKNSKNLFAGKYSSKLKGQGVEFCDLKVYEFGDDVRKIDWNVTARMNVPFVREFLEEKDASHYFLIDASGSMFNKLDEIKKLVSTLIFACNGFSDNFSVVICRKNFLKVVPLSKGKKHLIRCIYELSELKEEGFGDINVGLKYLLSTIKKNSVISIICDDLDLADDTLSFITALKKRNKVSYFNFYNSTELEFDLGLDVFTDSESGEDVMYDLDDDEVYEIILSFNNKLKNCEKLIKRTGSKYFNFDCKSSVVDAMRLERFEI
ncbi:MAG: DUF58 domain-containing protein [Nanoarchaeales archaeon]|nr:DUF58 domain-containing protein [Nanoarchaeales archaeon]